MKVRPTKTICCAHGSFYKGTVVELPEVMAISLLEAGAATPVRDDEPAVNADAADDFVDNEGAELETTEAEPAKEVATKRKSSRKKTGK